MAINWIDYVPGQGYASMPWAGDIFSPWRDPVLNWARQNGYTGDVGGALTGALNPDGSLRNPDSTAQLDPAIAALFTDNPDLSSPGLQSWSDGIRGQSTQANPDLDAWLAQNGYKVQIGRSQEPGASQYVEGQRILDSQGNELFADSSRYNTTSWGDRLGMLGVALGAGAIAGAGAGMFGAGMAPGGAAGTGTLGAGATGAGSAGLSTQALPAASELLGGLSSSSSLFNPMTMAPTFGGMTAGLGSASELLGGLSSESALFNPIAAAPESLTSVGYLGGGAAAPTVSTPGLGPEVTQGLGLSNPNPLALAPSLGGGSFLDAAKNLISGGGSLKDLGQVAAPIVGAIAGGASAGKPDTATTERKMDPRMDAYVYGTGPGDTNSLLGAAQQWFNQNKSGTNADMTAGMDMLRSLYTSPQYQQGYNNMRNVGQGLMNITPAGNPFTQGLLQTPQMGNPFGGQAPTVNLGGLLQPRTFG